MTRYTARKYREEAMDALRTWFDENGCDYPTSC